MDVQPKTIRPFQSFLSLAIFFLCCWYLLLCSVHYTRQRPLWLDEQSVFKSVAAFQPQEFFTRKLAVDQIFPRLYLCLIQKIAQPFDLNLLSLRFMSFVSMIAAFFIWLRIAKYELSAKGASAKLTASGPANGGAGGKDQLQYFTFVLSWTASSLLIYYSAELKPYSMDVLAGAIFIWFLYNQTRLAEGNKARYLAALVLLPLLGLFSYPAFLFFIFP